MKIGDIKLTKLNYGNDGIPPNLKRIGYPAYFLYDTNRKTNTTKSKYNIRMLGRIN
jgi:hypothetical protein